MHAVVDDLNGFMMEGDDDLKAGELIVDVNPAYSAVEVKWRQQRGKEKENEEESRSKRPTCGGCCVDGAREGAETEADGRRVRSVPKIIEVGSWKIGEGETWTNDGSVVRVFEVS